MGEERQADPALGLLAVLFGDPAVLEQAVGRLARELGPLQPAGPDLPFDWTDYYQPEMGPGLKRRFLVPSLLVERDALADWKRWTNRLERELAGPDGRRQVNLDPGLLGLDNLVLASTKSQPQRIYLRDGIWAEVTLWYVGGEFQPLPRTYADYRSPPVRHLLGGLRNRYKEMARGKAPLLTAAHLRRLWQEEERT